MIERMERLSRSGDKDAAKQLLDQLQQMLENLQMAQPGQSGDSDMEQALNELGDVIRKQQQLRDKTFRQGQDSRRDRQRGKQGDQSMSDLQQDQQGLRDRLKKLQQELAKRGMGQGQKGQKGQQGQQGEQGQQGDDGDQAADDGDSLGEADSAMGDADGKLGDGNSRVRWIRRARRWMRCARAPRSSRTPCSRAMAKARATVRAITTDGNRAAATPPIRSAGRCTAVNSATT